MDLNKILKIVIIFAILIISLSVAYHYIIFIPKNEEAKRVQEEQIRQEKIIQENLQKQKEEEAQKEKELNLNWCLLQADNHYTSNWEANCVLEGKPKTCTSLLQYHADNVSKTHQEEKDNCFSQYK